MHGSWGSEMAVTEPAAVGGRSRRSAPGLSPGDVACGTPVATGGSKSTKAKAAVFAVLVLAGTITVLALVFMAVAQRVAPDAYPGLRGFPKVGSMPSKSAGDLVTFVFAFLVGFLIQRSRWCNASAVRDAILFKSFRNTKPLVAAMMIITAMFSIFESAHLGQPISIVGGAFTVLGLFLFGIGMVLGGACTVSVWIRSAEGSVGALWALIYTFVGMFLFSELWNVMRWPAASYLQSAKPNASILSFGSFNAYTIRSLFGPTWGPVAVLVAGGLQVAVLALIYRKMLSVERRRQTVSLGGLAVAGQPVPVPAGVSATAAQVTTSEAPDKSTEARSSQMAARLQGPELAPADPASAQSDTVVEASGEDGRHFVDLANWGHVDIDRVIDCSGEMCPRPQLLTKRAIVREMSVGQVLELVVDNPSSPELVPTIMEDIGAVHLGTERDSAAWHLYIRKEREAQSRKGAARR